ncbi:hypothetical protein FRACYDRAFT_254633 [Fragilariopsis cylindrus CCMP1102]|uniref:Uncharacterized protein n=1 Tax=Fragilariopsis cylindrus CCMP1102 TaxID=635003 RepID=A0A1E7EKM3_9STRA|nr:hypothetical protein FRACYDRAFT_254633 [Fragilariopsis cylindrus CCMP1102]|eukprot:OEU06424.1 hypothetical protein FRACYDRAFT_254633 [Fragilariopsis cylindrus CCMP1102]
MTTRIIASSLLSVVETSTKTTTTTTTTTTSTSTTKCSNGTTIIREEATASALKSFNYVICDDPNNHSPFVNPTKIPPNKKSNGSSTLSSSSWPRRSTTPAWILKMFVLLDDLFVACWLPYVLQLWSTKISLSMKRSIIFFVWNHYLYLHTLVVCNYLGLYNSKSNQDDISDEYKAMSTLLYPSQFFQCAYSSRREPGDVQLQSFVDFE